jgi:hypothetical protein
LFSSWLFGLVRLNDADGDIRTYNAAQTAQNTVFRTNLLNYIISLTIQGLTDGKGVLGASLDAQTAGLTTLTANNVLFIFCFHFITPQR